MSVSFTLSQVQLKVLLKGRGYRSAVGILSDRTPLEDEMVLNALNEMVSKGLLVSSDVGFEAVSSLKKMVTVLGEARECYALTAVDPSLPDKCIYADPCGELQCVTLRGLSGHVTLTQMSMDEFTQSLCDEGYLPEGEYALLPDEEEMDAFEEKAFSEISKYASLDRESPILLNIELLSDSIPEKRFFRVMDYYLCEYIVYCCKGSLFRCEYSEETVKTIIKKMMKNDLC